MITFGRISCGDQEKLAGFSVTLPDGGAGVVRVWGPLWSRLTGERVIVADVIGAGRVQILRYDTAGRAAGYDVADVTGGEWVPGLSCDYCDDAPTRAAGVNGGEVTYMACERDARAIDLMPEITNGDRLLALTVAYGAFRPLANPFGRP